MPYRLPLELEFTILGLAAPPLAFDGLHDRVDFFINASLVHRSLTPWAQERLHDQFLYTYQPRPDEHERLKKRLEADFGRDLPLHRLYLDLRCLPSDISSEYGTDSASATIQGRVYEAVSLTDEAGHGGEGGTSGEQRASDAVARFLHAEDADPFLGHWHLCTIIAAYSQTIHVIWLKLPMMNLNVTNLPRPRVLYVDDVTHRFLWRLLPLSSETVLSLRSMRLGAQAGKNYLEIHHLILDNCWVLVGSIGDHINRLRHLETLVMFETEDHDLVSTIAALSPSIRRVHVLQHGIDINDKQCSLPKVLPRLRFFAFTLLPPPEEYSASQTPTDHELDPLFAVRQQVEAFIVAPLCTFKYIRSTKSPEDALADARADAMADLGLDL